MEEDKMDKIIDKLFSWSVEELRNEFCIEYNYNLMKIRVMQIKSKFKEVEEMMDSQLKVHKHWDK